MNRFKRSFPFFIIFLLLCGVLYSQVEPDRRKESLRKLVEAAEAGDAKALYDLARLHDTGYDTIATDSLRSTALYLLSAEKGYAPARNYIGFRYYNGEIVRKDIDSALYWIRLAADDGDITAAANLGYLLADSEEIEHDEEEALKWLTIASEAGVREAQMKWVTMQGHRWDTIPADSILREGLRLYGGRAPIAGTYLLEIAAEKDIPKAQALLGDAYSRGIGVPYDHSRSVEYFYKAAKNGDASAQFILAELLDFFPDTLEEEENAQYWYEKALEQGITDSESAYQYLFSLPEAEHYEGNH